MIAKFNLSPLSEPFHREDKVLILDLAHPVIPGGDWVKERNGQEEELFYRTSLSLPLNPMRTLQLIGLEVVASTLHERQSFETQGMKAIRSMT